MIRPEAAVRAAAQRRAVAPQSAAHDEVDAFRLGQGANRSDTGWQREDLQRRQSDKDAASCAAWRRTLR